MRVYVIGMTIVLHLLAFAAMAGPGHDHSHSHDPVTQEEAERLAMKEVKRLVEKGTLDTSWESVPVSTAVSKQFAESVEWVVVFNNRTIADPAKQTLYLFLTKSGEYLAANFTGQ